jgi:hypothetical protein
MRYYAGKKVNAAALGKYWWPLTFPPWGIKIFIVNEPVSRLKENRKT